MIPFLQSSLQRIALAILQCLEFDIYDVRKVEEKSQKITKVSYYFIFTNTKAPR